MGLLSCCSGISEEGRLLKDCYPPSKQLLPAPTASTSTEGEQKFPAPSDDNYKPLSQELSRLTYYASNKPGKLNKLAEELEERARGESAKAAGGNVKSRILFLISLSILRSLLSECKRDIHLFARSAVRILDLAMGLAIKPAGAGAGGRGMDWEVAVRAGTVFNAFATYAEGSAIAADESVMTTYLSVLKKFAGLAVQPQVATSGTGNGGGEKQVQDFEVRNRTRLIGLAALSAAVQTDLLFASRSDFSQQAKVVIPALMQNLWLGDLDESKLELAKAQIDFSPSPYFSEFSTKRPVSDRRAPSLRAHVIGEKGPSTSDVVGASLRTLRELIGDCHSTQLATALEIILQCIDKGLPNRSRSAWDDEERCCWLAETITTFTLLQYRYAMPAALLDAFMACLDVNPPVKKQGTLLRMLDTILRAEKLTLTGVSPTEVLGVLVPALLVRIKVDAEDALLGLLVAAVEAIGSHIYYADQANDMIEDIVGRIADLQTAGQKIGNRSRKSSRATDAPTPTKVPVGPVSKKDTESIRMLIACMTNIMLAGPDVEDGNAEQGSIKEISAAEMPLTPMSDKGKGRDMTRTPVSRKDRRRSRRNPITPEVWQETLPLLCESSFAVRTEYARSLLLYLHHELPAYQDLHSGPDRKDVPASITRFMHALNATLYTLAISSKLGFAGPAVVQQQLPSVDPNPEDLERGDEIGHLRQETNTHSRIMVESPTPGTLTPEEPKEAPKMARRTSKLVALPYAKNDSSTAVNLTGQAAQAEDTAGSCDYLFIREVVTAIVFQSPKISLITLAPMLLALDRDAGTLVRRPHDNRENVFVAERRKATREVICSSWLDIAKAWGLDSLSRGVHDVYSSMGSPAMVHPGPMGEAEKGIFLPAQTVPFPILAARGETSVSTKPVVNPDFVAANLAENRGIQHTLGLESGDITDLLGRAWSVQWALANSVENSISDFAKAAIFARRQSYSNGDISLESNGSLRSFSAPPTNQGIDVGDLRDALGARRTNSNPRLKSASASVSTNGTAPTAHEAPSADLYRPEPKRLKPDDARALLKDLLDKQPRGHKTRTDRIPEPISPPQATIA